MSKPDSKSFTAGKLAKMGVNHGATSNATARDHDRAVNHAPASRGSGMDDAKAAKPRMDRPGYKRGGAVGKGKTTVNVIIGGQKPADPPTPTPVPVPVPAEPPPAGPMPAARPPMPMPPPGAMAGPGGPPMPMRARGGAVKMHAGAGSGEGRLEKARKAD